MCGKRIMMDRTEQLIGQEGKSMSAIKFWFFVLFCFCFLNSSMSQIMAGSNNRQWPEYKIGCVCGTIRAS